nr:hypothetical protein [Tanacetum cinerariifolium]
MSEQHPIWHRRFGGFFYERHSINNEVGESVGLVVYDGIHHMTIGGGYVIVNFSETQNILSKNFISSLHVGSRPLAAIVSNRDIHRAGFNLYSKVKDAIHNGEWSWPVDWFSKYPLFNLVAVPTLSAMHDRLEWRNRLEIVKPFSVNAVWNCIRPRDAVVI